MTPDAVEAALARVKAHVSRTPLLRSHLLNGCLGADIVFKYEGAQKVGAFKSRGALNTLLRLRERGELPKEAVAFSSGNHAQAVAWAARQLGVRATVVIPAAPPK